MHVVGVRGEAVGRRRGGWRARSIAPVLIALALVACGAEPSTQVSAGPPTTAEVVRTTGSTPPSSAPVRIIRADDGHKRVLFVGDSLMFGAYDALDFLVTRAGVEAHYVGFTATGLLSGQGWWLRSIEHEVATFDPDVVVIESCCNYGAAPLFVRDGKAVVPDSEAMFEAWADNAQRAVTLAGALGAKVYWVVTPDGSVLVTSKFQNRIHRFNAIYFSLGVPMIDWRAALQPDGWYATSVPFQGHLVQVRRDDGMHFTRTGDVIVGVATWKEIRRNFA